MLLPRSSNKTSCQWIAKHFRKRGKVCAMEGAADAKAAPVSGVVPGLCPGFPMKTGYCLSAAPGRWRHGCAVLLPSLWQ